MIWRGVRLRWASEQWQIYVGNHLMVLYIGADVDVVKKDREIS